MRIHAIYAIAVRFVSPTCHAITTLCVILLCLCFTPTCYAMPMLNADLPCHALASRFFAMPLPNYVSPYQRYALLHCATALLRQSLLLSAVTMTCPSSLCPCCALLNSANATHTWNCFTFAAHCRDSPCQGCDLVRYAVAMICFSLPTQCSTTTAPLNPCVTIRGRTPLRFANA